MVARLAPSMSPISILPDRLAANCIDCSEGLNLSDDVDSAGAPCWEQSEWCGFYARGEKRMLGEVSGKLFDMKNAQ